MIVPGGGGMVLDEIDTCITIKSVQSIKKQVFHQHVVDNQKSYASILKQNSVPLPQTKGDTFSFTADQLKICSHCDHLGSSATGVPHKCPKRNSGQNVKSVSTSF